MRGLYFVFATLLALANCAGAACAQGKATLADRVQVSIKKGTRYLLNRQGGDGSWEQVAGYAEHKGGATALVTLALLNAGVSDADRPKLERAIANLRSLESEKVYVRALQTMALVEAGFDPQRPAASRNIDLELVRKNVKWLIAARAISKTGRLEGWGYGTNPNQRNSSTTQYAVLGLWAGKQAGI
jgi:hypothetical protein